MSMLKSPLFLPLYLFFLTQRKSLNALLRSTIFLTCIVRNEGTTSEDAVWQGLREDTPSSVEKYRFSVRQSADNEDTIHTLEIRDLNEEDEGLYKCKRLSDSSTDYLAVNVLRTYLILVWFALP